MRGRVCVVTGANGGIGRATALALAAQGATVALVCRRADAGRAARDEIIRATGSDEVHLLLADLSAQAEVRRAAAELLGSFDRIHVLVNNAALYTRRRRVTVDGIEAQWAVNHLAPFLLTNLLLGRLTESAPARVVTVSSNAHRDARLRWDDLTRERGRYRGLAMYSATKLANLLFTRELARRTLGSGVTANALHPGVVATELLLNGFPPLRLFRRFLRTPEQGAATAVHLAASPEVEGVTGEYFVDGRIVAPDPAARDDHDARRLWEASAAMTGLA